jgi:polyamine oxidase
MAGEDYDDGRTDVPGGVTGPVERVVVVGAGMSGLAAANALVNAQVECVVVEARERIGGRLETVDLLGVPVDMGGSWIHHPRGNPIRAFAGHVGVSCHDGNPLPALGGFDCAEGRRLSPDEVAASLRLQFEGFPAAVPGLRATLGSDASVAQGIEAFIARAGLIASPARRARQALRAMIEADAADHSDRQSLRWLWNEVEYEGNLFGDLPAGGYRSLVDAMASGLDVQLGFDATEIVLSADGVAVRSEDGAAEEGSHAVVTLPLGVLEAGTTRFSPALPADRVAAIERLGFGCYEKVALVFDRPFWREAGLSHMMLFPHDPDEAALWVFDLDAFGDGPALVCHLFASTAGHVVDATLDEAAAWVEDMLGQALGARCPSPSAAAVSSWANDACTRGAYTHIPPGAVPGDVELLGEPIGGRLLFAGEHTQSARLGYADGAMSSGIREAKRLLERSSVRLGRTPMTRTP